MLDLEPIVLDDKAFEIPCSTSDCEGTAAWWVKVKRHCADGTDPVVMLLCDKCFELAHTDDGGVWCRSCQQMVPIRPLIIDEGRI